MSVVFLGVGSNLGNRKANIQKAVTILRKNPQIKVRKISGFYETLPVGGPPQSKFLNGAIKIETSLSPNELLSFLKDVEKRVGRKPSRVKWGPRIIDLDILLFGNKVISEPNLKIPHPYLHKRLFVLNPLADISPLTRHPILKKTVKKILEEHEGYKE